MLSLLRFLLLRADPSRSGKWLPADTSKNEPPPGFIANVIYLPGLDEKGEAEESSTIIAIDQSNYRVMLPELKDFLVRKKVLNNDHPKEKALTSGEKG